MANKNLPSDDEIIDLTELIESGSGNTPAQGASAYAKAASAQDDSDFETLLAGMDTGMGDQQDKTEVNADEQLDMSAMGDIDSLLDSFDIPAQPKEKPKPRPAPEPAAPPSAGNDDLDSVLDDLLNPASGAKAKVTREQSAEAGISDTPSLSELDADLNDILIDAEALIPESPQKNTVPKPDLSAGGPDIDFEIPEPPISEPVSTAEAPSPLNDLGFLDLEEEKVTGAPSDHVLPEPAAVSHIINPVDNPTSSVSVQPLADSPVSGEMLASICGGIIKAQAGVTEETLRDLTHKLGVQSGLVEEMSKRLEALSAALRENERELADTREKLAALESSAPGAGTVNELVSEGTDLHNGFMGLISAAVGKAMENNAPQPEMAIQPVLDRLSFLENSRLPLTENLAALEKRLVNLETSLEQKDKEAEDTALAELQSSQVEIDNRLTALADGQNDIAARFASLDAQVQPLANVSLDFTDVESRLAALEGHESGLLAKFAGIEGRLDTLENGLSEVSLKLDTIAIPDLPERLQALLIAEKSAAERLDVLEKRIDALDPKFNEDVEKAAAKAVVKILHEEIGRLMAGE